MLPVPRWQRGIGCAPDNRLPKEVRCVDLPASKLEMMAFADICGLLAQQTVQDPRAGMAQTLGLMVFMGLAMYFLMFRPQQKKAREHANLLKTIKNGDRVVTTSGILGTIIGIKDKSVSLRSADTKLEVLKSSIAEVTERGAAES